MKRIVDLSGNPIDTEKLKEFQTTAVTWLHREFAQHPVKGLTPPKLAQLLEKAEAGDLIAQCELADDIEERDAHIFAELSKRKRAVLTFDWSIEPPRNADPTEKAAAEAIQEQIQAIPDFEDVLIDMMDALLKGFSCLELEWKYTGIWHPTIYHRDPSWFTVSPQDRNTLLLRSTLASPEMENITAEPLRPFGWITHIHRSKSGYLPRVGLIRTLAWLFLFKNYSIRDLAELLEIYGVPIGIGKYPPNANPQEKATLLDALISIGHNARGIIPQGMDISFLSEAKGNADGFQLMLEFCDRSASKAIVGGTLTTDSSGGTKTNALGDIHERAFSGLVLSDLRQLASTLTRDLVYPLQVLNTRISPDRRLRFKFDTVDLTVDQVRTFKEIGWVFPLEFLSKKFQLPVARPEEPTLDNAFPEQKDIGIAPIPEQAALKTNISRISINDAVDEFAKDLADEWRPVMSPIINPILNAANQANSYEEFEDLIAKTNLDDSELIKQLSQALFQANIFGRIRNNV